MNKIIIKKTGAVCLSVMLGAVLLCSCASPIGGGGAESASDAGASEEEAKLDVEVRSPEVKEVSISSNFAGTVVAESEVYVIPMISGEVVEKNYEVGDHVNEGDLLFKIDDEALQIALTQAEANVTSAQAGLASSKAQAEYTKAQANTTRASATRTVGEMPYDDKTVDYSVDQAYVNKRSSNHSFQNAMDAVDTAEETLDDYKDALDAAKSALSTAEASLQSAKASGDADAIATAQSYYDTVESTKEAAEQRVEAAERSLDSVKRAADDAEMGYELAKESYGLAQMKQDNYYTYDKAVTIYGAYASAVGANASDVGADASVTSSAATVKQAQAGLDSAKLQLEYTNVKAPVSGTITAIGVTLHNMATQSSAAYTIQSDDPNKIVFYAAEETAKNIRPGSEAVVTKNGIDYKAKILTVYDTIDASTGLFKIEASVTDSGAEAGLISGSSVSIRTVTRRSDNALTVPIDAVYYDGDQAYVYVDDSGRAKRLDVTTGISDEESIEVTQGLTKDDKVIVSWSGSLRDGTAISATDSMVPVAAGAGDEG